MLSSTAIFNIDDNNNKYLMITKLVYYKDLWRIMWH